jgi:DNA-binding transcriptional MocR family regulator
MTNWQPDLARYKGPRYRAIAEALASDVRNGRLPAGTRLPTHRDLAWRLKVTIGTVSRAYAEAERRGLIAGEVGRGTYVRPSGMLESGVPGFAAPRLAGAAAAERADFVDLTRNVPPLVEEPALLAATLQRLAAAPGIAELLHYQPHAGRAEDRSAGAAWLARAGLQVPPERIVVTNGVQHALSIVLPAVLRPGDTLAVEALTYPGLRSLANLLDIRLAAVAMDEHGVLPQSFADLCREGACRAFYVTPSLHNPTTTILPLERRRAIAEIAAAHDVAIIEDDVYGFLLEAPPKPIASLAPAQGFFVTSVSKSLAPGLRIGYVAAPPDKVDRVVAAMRSTTYMATPLTARIATTWIEDGDADRLVMRKRETAARRQAIASEALAGARFDTHPAALHLWLHLPETWRADDFAAAARRRGVGVTPAAAFAVGRAAPNGVRVCLGTPDSEAGLRRALEILAELLRAAPEPYLSVV